MDEYWHNRMNCDKLYRDMKGVGIQTDLDD